MTLMDIKFQNIVLQQNISTFYRFNIHNKIDILYDFVAPHFCHNLSLMIFIDVFNRIKNIVIIATNYYKQINNERIAS